MLFVFGLTLLLWSHFTFAADDEETGNRPNAKFNERILMVTVSQAPPVRLQVTIFMPPRGGPFPLVVINHGAAHDPKRAPRVADEFIPYYFLSRGYAVALPMVRGYAGSDGHIKRYVCDVSSLGLDSAHDIAAVIDDLRQNQAFDTSRIVIAGKSMGGWNTLAAGTLNIPNVVGLVDFAGGVKESDCASPDQSLIDAAGKFGAQTKIPSIWIYGENDKIFSTSTWQSMYRQYTRNGARATLVDYGNFMDDAHAMTANGAGLPLWVDKVDAFLRQLGLPATLANSEFLPEKAPAASGYAAIDDIAAVPFLSEAQRAEYRMFLATPLPRAFALGATGAATASGGFDPAAAAMATCWRKTKFCELYAVDKTVVWPRLVSVPAAKPFAELANVAAVPYVHADGRQAYSSFLTAGRPRAFAVAPDGGWGIGKGLDPINDALVQCNERHQSCRIYAVDGDVVWGAH